MLTEQKPLILASTSRYRAELLARLHMPFTALASAVDETPLPDEDVPSLTRRLANAKAQALAQTHPDRWVLGADQAASANAQILGKPGNHARAVDQLRMLSGQSVEFFTAVTLQRGSRALHAMDITTVRFRHLEDAEIERYLTREPAYDCAGSFKCEGLGISLFEDICSNDPTALVGLPLIAVRRLLAEAGFAVP